MDGDGILDRLSVTALIAMAIGMPRARQALNTMVSQATRPGIEEGQAPRAVAGVRIGTGGINDELRPGCRRLFEALLPVPTDMYSSPVPSGSSTSRSLSLSGEISGAVDREREGAVVALPGWMPMPLP